MNIALTTECNNHCPFCFQNNLHKNPQEMSLDNLNKLIEWGKQSFPGSVSILGGEPTLHSKFKEAFEIIYNGFFFAEILLITNLLGPSEVFHYLSHYNNLHYLVNISYDENKKDLFFKNLEIIKDTGSSLAISITLSSNTQLNMKYITRLISLIQDYSQIKEIRVGLECPQSYDFDFLEYNYDNEILYLIEELPKYDHGIYVHFDCPITLCQLSNKIVNKINCGETIFQPKINFKCPQPCIDVMPDLSSRYCFSSSDDFKIDNILDHKDETYLCSYLKNKANKYKIQNRKCLECKFYLIDCFPCHAFDEILKGGN